MTLILIFLFILVLGFHYYIRGGRRGELINKIPGPASLPIVGNVLLFNVPMENLFTLVRTMSAEYYPIHKIWSVKWPVVNIMHPDDVEALLSSMKHIRKSMIYDLLRSWLGTGLITSTGSKWQSHRKMLTPAFHYKVLREFVDVFVEEGEWLVKNLMKEGGEPIKDLVPFCREYTLNTICETSLGTRLYGKDLLLAKYKSAIQIIAAIIPHRIVRPWLHFDWTFSLSSKGREYARALKEIDTLSTKIIEERKQYHEQTGGKHLKSFLPKSKESLDALDEDVYSGKRRKLAMLDLLIAEWRNGTQMDDQSIKDEVNTFMFAGHDTTGMTLCFSLLLLAEHKESQNRARIEVDALLEESKGKMTMNEVQRMFFLDRCIKESLRLFPSVPMISRNIDEDLQLKNYLVPGGTIVHVHIYDLHRDSNFWPNPNTFDPDRFLPERIQSRHPFSYVPFSAGPRNCIGQRFAMLELKSIIASLLHNFYLEPIDFISEIRFTADLVLRPAHPLRVKFIPIRK